MYQVLGESHFWPTGEARGTGASQCGQPLMVRGLLDPEVPLRSPGDHCRARLPCECQQCIFRLSGGLGFQVRLGWRFHS